MDHQASEFASALERMTARLENLERRLSALEKAHGQLPQPESSERPVAGQSMPERLEEQIQSASLISVLGKSLLGIAGAYLLRAAAESAAFPKLTVVIAALVYAWLWQYLSLRARKSSQSASFAYGITSALILFPMLWECTVDFKILPPEVTALVLVASVISALILGWSGNASATVWATSVFSAGSALGLLVATRDPFPFVVALVLIAALIEFAAYRGKIAGLKHAISVPVNLAFVALLYLASRPEGFPAEYIAIPRLTLLAALTFMILVYAAGTIVRTIRLQDYVSYLDVGQTAVSFALLLMAVFYLGGEAEAKVFGISCVFSSLAAYCGAFFSERIRSQPRKYQIYISWASALLLIGGSFAFQRFILTVLLGLTAVLFTGIAIQAKNLTLGFHGFLFLLAAQIWSGILVFAGQMIVGSQISLHTVPAWWVAIAAGTCSFILLFKSWDAAGLKAVRFCSIANSAVLLTAFTVFASASLFHAGSSASSSKLALIRTVSICLVTLIVAVLGAVLKSVEIIWVAYTLLGLGTLKLVFEDLRLGSTGSFALSLLAFGIVLAIVPWIVRSATHAAAEHR
jgi:hypothetical protein